MTRNDENEQDGVLEEDKEVEEGGGTCKFGEGSSSIDEI